MSAKEKAQVLEKVEATAGSKRKVLSELGVSNTIADLVSISIIPKQAPTSTN